MKNFLIGGSHPLLSLAEARAVIGGQKPILADTMFIFDTQNPWDETALQNRLAGTVKLGEIIAESRISNLESRIADLIEATPRADRVLFGLTIFGGNAKQRKKLERLPIELKKELKRRGHSSRWVTGERGALAPAAVAKLKLTNEGYDFCIALMQETIYVGLTTHVQDADAWSLRDYGRPFRDARTGMLPPKLARLMVNLAVGADDKRRLTVYDPFCGGGAILAESLLMLTQATMIGSDIDEKQVVGCRKNLEWIKDKRLISSDDLKRLKLFVSPAQEAAHHLDNKVDVIVTEGFLGKPLQGNEPQKFLDENLTAVEEIWQESLPSLAKLQTEGGRLVACAPIYETSRGQAAFDLRPLVERFGYKMTEREILIYKRPRQSVGRRIFVFEKSAC